MTETSKNTLPLADGTVYSRRKNFCPFSTPPLEAYTPMLGEKKIERLQKAAQALKGLKLLELNSSAQGGSWYQHNILVIGDAREDCSRDTHCP